MKPSSQVFWNTYNIYNIYTGIIETPEASSPRAARSTHGRSPPASQHKGRAGSQGSRIPPGSGGNPPGKPRGAELATPSLTHRPSGGPAGWGGEARLGSARRSSFPRLRPRPGLLARVPGPGAEGAGRGPRLTCVPDSAPPNASPMAAPRPRARRRRPAAPPPGRALCACAARPPRQRGVEPAGCGTAGSNPASGSTHGPSVPRTWLGIPWTRPGESWSEIGWKRALGSSSTTSDEHHHVRQITALSASSSLC